MGFFEVFENRSKPKSSPLVTILRWGIPLIFVIFGVVMLIMSGGHATGIKDSMAETNPFAATSTNRDSILTTIGVASLVVAVMLWMIGWMTRLSFASDSDRHKEDEDRAYFAEHGRWPSE